MRIHWKSLENKMANLEVGGGEGGINSTYMTHTPAFIGYGHEHWIFKPLVVMREFW